MDDSRFSRLENRVDEIKDDLSEVKAEQKVTTNSLTELKDVLREYVQAANDHITGDQKIITEIVPIITELKPIVEEYKFQKDLKERTDKERDEKMTRYKHLATKIGIPAVLLGMMGTAIKIWTSF